MRPRAAFLFDDFPLVVAVEVAGESHLVAGREMRGEFERVEEIHFLHRAVFQHCDLRLIDFAVGQFGALDARPVGEVRVCRDGLHVKHLAFDGEQFAGVFLGIAHEVGEGKRR